MAAAMLRWPAVALAVATSAVAEELPDALSLDDECTAAEGEHCGINALQRRTMRGGPLTSEAALDADLGSMLPPPRTDGNQDVVVEAVVDEVNQANWAARVACVANPYSKAQDIEAAVSWACGAMGTSFDCQSVPAECKQNVYRNADYIFGTYYRQFGSDEQDCKFGGAGILSDVSGLSAEQKHCMVKTPDKHKDVARQEFEMRACVAAHGAEASALTNAISWACGQLPESVCQNIPNSCKGNTVDMADYVLGTYYKQKAAADASFDCAFGGAGAWASSSELASRRQDCVVQVTRSSRSQVGKTTEGQQNWLACKARRGADKEALHQAIQYACSTMPDFNCAFGPPPQCANDVFSRADYIFGTYVNSLRNPTKRDCDFAGSAELVKFDALSSDTKQCVVHLEKPIGEDKPEQAAPPEHHGNRPVGPVQKPPPQTPNNLPTLDEASVSHYSRFSSKDMNQLASGCMPGRFYQEVVDHKDEIQRDAPHLEGWYLAAAPIWMTQPMHGRNTASHQAGIGRKTAWFDDMTGHPNLPNGPATGMMFDGGEAVDGYETSDGCWEASWDDESGRAHRVGMVVLDNCGHSDGITNTVHNIKWCVPFQFTAENRGATCPMAYYDKCFPEKQAMNFGERPYCHGDFEVIRGLRVTDNAPWAKMVVGTYTEEWCKTSGRCPYYTSREAAAANHTISWSGRASPGFHSEGKCKNSKLNLPPDQMPELGSCSANIHDSEGRCRNAYGFPFHFDVATFKNDDGSMVQPPWAERNTRVYGVRRVACPAGMRKAMLGSCGMPDMFVGNNLVWGSQAQSYIPPSWCKESLRQCLANPMYRSATSAYLASTGHAFCHSEQCKKIHAAYR